MVTEPSWGRNRRMKQESLPLKANDRCGGMDWSHYPAWTESMRAALKTRQESGGKWFSLIDRMWDPRLLQAAWERLNRRVTGEKRRRGAGVDGVTVEGFAKRAGEEISRLAGELRAGTYRPRAARRHYIPKPGTTKKRPLGLPTVSAYCTSYNTVSECSRLSFRILEEHRTHASSSCSFSAQSVIQYGEPALSLRASINPRSIQ